MIRLTNQGGSVATFIIIGIILVSGLVGTTYFLNQRGQQVRKDQEIAASNEEQNNKKPIKSDGADKTKADTSKTSVNMPGKSSDSQDLPDTGIELSIVELTGTYSLVVVFVAYMLSRRKSTYSL